MTKIAYIDGSGSTTALRKYYGALGVLYQHQGWQVYEFSTEVRPWTHGSYYGGGTNPRAILDHLVTRVRAGRDTNSAVTDVVVITDGDLAALDFNLNHFPDFRPLLVQVRNKRDYTDAYTQIQNAHRRKQAAPGFVEAIRQHEQRLGDKTAFFDELYCNSHADMYTSINTGKSLSDQFLHPNPSRPQEAHMNTRPTIVTTVSLDRSRATEQPTIGDLRTLITEVERVGGDDNSQVRLDQDSYRWNVTLSVKANEIETERVLTDEEQVSLLVEYRATGTTKARKSEIKTLLGL